MKKLEKIRKVISNKKIIIILIILAICISLFSIATIIIGNIKRNKEAEKLSDFAWETRLFTLNDDYTYNFLGLVTVKEVDGIDTITYQKDGKETVLKCNGKQSVAIDFKAIENTDYEFKIKPVGKSEKKEILNVKRKFSGEGTYKLINGVYVNTPFLENFNKKYTRYLNPKDDQTLEPSNWINDTEPENWYDYNNQKWANVYVEAEGVEAYYVWVPRYVYKLDQDTQRSDVKFVDINNNYIDAQTGDTITYSELIEQGYQLPQAFEFADWSDNKSGEADVTSISGYWISKYQLSELAKFNIDYNMSASKSSIVVRNFTNNVTDKAVSFTYSLNGQIKHTSNTLEEYIFTGLTENEAYVVNITALDNNGAIVGSMTKTLEPTEVNTPNLQGFDPDTTFYVYYDEDGTEHNEIPISKEAPSSWYNYTYSNWANIVARNDGLETYYVWIPRYQYKLNQTSQRSDVKFILGTSTTTETGYQIPEAFWWDKNDDGKQDDGEQLSGYWITKYQLSREESNARITAELSPSSDCIHVKNITGTLLQTTNSEGNIEDVPIKYEYYLNGELKHEGTSNTENYTYVGLNINTTYTINIIARNLSTNKYIGAITKKVTTKVANDPDLASFKSNGDLKARTYYVVYDGENVSKYVPIEENAPSNWYDYSQSRWANIVVTDGTINGTSIENATATSYFVWVPRYEYKILNSVNDWSNLDVSNARTDVKFLNGTENTADAGYQIPEAFWWDKNDNGTEDDGEQLSGYWISKYQLSN